MSKRWPWAPQLQLLVFDFLGASASSAHEMQKNTLVWLLGNALELLFSLCFFAAKLALVLTERRRTAQDSPPTSHLPHREAVRAPRRPAHGYASGGCRWQQLHQLAHGHGLRCHLASRWRASAAAVGHERKQWCCSLFSPAYVR